MTPAIEIRQVHKRFGGVHALRGVDLTVAQGEFFALLGPNGAGKSTLINILAGLARADSGRLTLPGHDVRADYRQARRALAAFQNFVIMPLTFLSGVFYAIHSLPSSWVTLSHFNPFFYMIDGLRYGFLGISDVAPSLSLSIVAASFLALSLPTLTLLGRGYKLRH